MDPNPPENLDYESLRESSVLDKYDLGMRYYRDHHYKNANDCFREAYHDDNCDSSLKQKCKDLMDECKSEMSKEDYTITKVKNYLDWADNCMRCNQYENAKFHYLKAYQYINDLQYTDKDDYTKRCDNGIDECNYQLNDL